MIVCLVFFFFKQKTAYEMRISDWSSDVCSSDLFRRCRGNLRGGSRVACGLRRMTVRIIDCKKCNHGCFFRSCNIHCAVQYNTCLLGILSQNFYGQPLGGPFFRLFWLRWSIRLVRLSTAPASSYRIASLSQLSCPDTPGG